MNNKSNSFTASLWQMTLMGLRYLSGRKLRTTLTTLAIVFGVALIFASNIVLPGVLESFSQTMTVVSGADEIVTSTSGESFTPDIIDKIAAVDQVQTASGILRRQFSVPALGTGGLGAAEQITLVGYDPETIQQVRQFVMSDGVFLQPGDTGKAVLPASISEIAPQLQVGTIFPLVTAGGLKLYTVVGLLANTPNGAAPEVMVSLEDAQAAFNQPGLINTVEVALKPGADRDAARTAILNAVGSGYQLNTTGSASGAFATAQAGFAIFDVFGLLALFLGAFLIFNTFRTIIVERRRDLGMLRAIGATRQQITSMILIESLVQGVLGTLIGLVAGYLLSSGMAAIMGKIASQFFKGTLILTPTISLTALIGPVVLGLGTVLLAGYLPARAASHTSPLEALRPSTVESVKRTARWSLIGGIVFMLLGVVMLASGARGAAGGAVMFLVGIMLMAPGLVIPASRLFGPFLTLLYAREGDLARGNLARQPGRAAITGGTLMIGLATLILMAALVDGVAGMFTSISDRTFTNDIILVPQSIGIYNSVIGADSSLADRLKALPDVQTVGTLRYAAATSMGQGIQVMGIDPVAYPQVSTLTFMEGNPEEALAALGTGRSAIMTSIGLSTLGLKVGDDMVVQTAEGDQTYHIVGAANDLFSVKLTLMFISQDNLAADFHKTEDIMLMLNLKPGADKNTALAQVEDISKDYPQFTAHLTGEYRDFMVQTTNSVLWLFYFVALLILIPAALGLLNTLTINVLERTREIGVVRAVGGSRSQVRRMVTAEALLLGIFGSALGVLAGVAMSYGFISAFGAIGWTMPYVFPVLGIIAAIVVGVLLALFASLLPARSAAKLDIIRALQYE